MNNKPISVKNISKIYRIYRDPKERFWESVTNGKKTYGQDHYALKNICFDVEEGEILGIIGENGSGKSTLLKIITGVLSPSCGTVEINGKISSLLELGAGFNPEYTGIENIYFNGMIMGFSREEMDKKIQGIIDFADIGEFVYQPVKTYSSGMYVRLAYSVAVSIEPDILIVDEALSVGDAYFQMKSMSKMQELFRKGKTVLFVSHDTASVKQLCSKAIYLKNGEMIAYGSAGEVVDLYEKHVRDNMSATKKDKIEDEISTFDSDNQAISHNKFVINEQYLQRVKSGREGNCKARVCEVKLLNAGDEEISEVVPFEKYIIRIYIEVLEECQFSIGYHIRDNNNIPVLGSNTVIEGMGEYEGKKGDKIVVDFKTSLPLRDGRYNIMTVLSHTLLLNRTVEFVELTKDGFYFDVLEAKPIRIWNTVQLTNTITIRKGR